MLDEFNVLKIVAKRLNENSIPYMLSGSVAMNYYTQPRMTRDIDIIIEINYPEKFYQLFKNDFYINLKSIENAISKELTFNIIHLEELIKIDFIIKKKSEYRENEFKRRIKIRLDDLEVFIVSIEDLILSKLLWAKENKSEIQINDVKNLLKENINLNYIKDWSKKLSIKDTLDNILED